MPLNGHFFMASTRGLEPPTHSLGNCCSILMSYVDTIEIIIIKNRFMQLFILHLLSTRGFYSIHMKNHGENGGGKQHNWYRAKLL